MRKHFFCRIWDKNTQNRTPNILYTLFKTQNPHLISKNHLVICSHCTLQTSLLFPVIVCLSDRLLRQELRLPPRGTEPFLGSNKCYKPFAAASWHVFGVNEAWRVFRDEKSRAHSHTSLLQVEMDNVLLPRKVVLYFSFNETACIFGYWNKCCKAEKWSQEKFKICI